MLKKKFCCKSKVEKESLIVFFVFLSESQTKKARLKGMLPGITYAVYTILNFSVGRRLKRKAVAFQYFY